MKNIALTVMVLVALILGVTPEAFASIIYNDDFTGSSLDSGWQIDSGQGRYSLTDGNLRYYNDGPLSSYATWSTKSLEMIYPFAGSNWEIDVKAKYNLYYAVTGAQRPFFMVSFDPGSRYSNYVSIDRGVDQWYGNNHLNAFYTYGGTVVPNNYLDNDLLNPSDKVITDNVADGTYWYKIIRQGDNLSVRYSYNGVDYNTAFDATLHSPSVNNEIILSGITWATVGSYTDYDYIRISGTVPESSTVMLMGLGTLGLAFMHHRTRKFKQAA